MISKEYLISLINYNHDTGEFRWIKTGKGRRLNGIAGTKSHGYILITINGTRYPAHRLAWLYVHGSHPKDCIDHINGNRSDNRISNLRQATNMQNHWNTKLRSTNTSGVKGVNFHKKAQKWCAEVWTDGKKNYLGLYEDIEEARRIVENFRKESHGEFANLG